MLSIEIFIFSFICISFTTSEKFCPNEQPMTHWGLVDADIMTILYKHLQYRYDAVKGRIPNQPAAKFMNMLEWDDVLAESAQKLAETCAFDEDVARDDRWEHVGQNIIKASSKFSKNDNWEAALETWFSEQENYNTSDKSSNTLNYEQIISPNTTHIGCGFVEYKSTDFIYPYESLYICNYGPAVSVNQPAPYFVQND